ncbi:MAG: site-specific integrase [Sulfurimonas sp.]|jgi:integrase
METTNPNNNQMTLSKKYQGVYSKQLPNNQIMMYIAYKNNNGNYSKYKVGLKSSTITEQFCSNLRQNELSKIRLGDEIQLSSKTIIKFDEIANDYYYNMELNQCSDTRNSKNKYINHIKPVFGNINIYDIAPIMINEYKILKLKSLAPATVAMQISFISSIYNHALKTKKFKGSNPALGIESTIHVDNARERYLTLEEIHSLIEVLKSNKYKNKPAIAKLLLYFVKFALSTGARASSIINIKRSNIDLKTQTVQIFDTKNKSWYTAYMNSKIFNSEDFLFIEGFKNSDYIFYNNGRKLTHRIIAYHTRPIYNEMFNVGLAEDDYKFRVCNHTLRHTFASHLAINQVPLFEIQKLLNHKDINMTLRYMKLSEANKVSAVEGIY